MKKISLIILTAVCVLGLSSNFSCFAQDIDEDLSDDSGNIGASSDVAGVEAVGAGGIKATDELIEELKRHKQNLYEDTSTENTQKEKCEKTNDTEVIQEDVIEEDPDLSPQE